MKLYTGVIAECVAHEDFQPLAVFLNQWRYTASLYRDANIMNAYSGTIVEDDVTGRPAAQPQSAARERRRSTTGRSARARRRLPA